MSRMLIAALAYVDNGWPVFPCRPREKVPATSSGFKDATLDRRKVEEWWRKMPEANVAAPTGPESGIFVLDVDGSEGFESLLDLGHGFPCTLTQETPSGGAHFVFRYPGGDLGNTASKVGPRLDTRGAGGYVLLAPSIHPNGGRYRWGGKQTPEPVPGWLIRLLRPAPKDRPRPARTVNSDLGGYVGRACEAEAEMVATAAEGGRNDTLNRAGFNLGQLVGAALLDRGDAYKLLEDAATSCGLNEGEIRQTLGRALDDGAKHPREVAA